MLQECLNERNLPKLLSREEMIDILQKEVYGYIPNKPEKLEFDVEELIPNFCAGKAVLNKVNAKCVINGKDFSFPFYASLHTDGKKHPFFIHINFRDCVPDRYLPVEEIVDNGFSVLSFCYEDVTSDNNDMTNGLAGVLYEGGKRGPDDAGKIAMWAWSAQRVMDYAETLSDVLDLGCATVCGHSRLGKTALLTAATDQRFAVAYSNDSGCSGAALTRGNKGEDIKAICDMFPFWFTENYKNYAGKEDTMPFDQHFLLAGIAPRKAVVGSAVKDAWADPVSEFLCCKAASTAFENGFVCEDRLPEIDDVFFEGDVGYHLRAGTHYFSRLDWQRIMQYVKLHFNY